MPIAPQRFLIVFPCFPCLVKARYVVCAVFVEQLFVKTSKIPKGIPVGIFEGFSAVLAERCLRKPIGIRFPSAYASVMV